MNKFFKVALAVSGVGLLLYLTKDKLPMIINTSSRGYRNNNPLNIRIGSSAWKGKVPVSENSDGAFEQFTDAKYGFRAAAKLVRNYSKLYGVNTAGGIISRWAPSVGVDPQDGSNYSNHTDEYIDFVEEKTGLGWTEFIDDSNVGKLVWAMAQFENTAPHPYSLAYVNDAVKIA